MCKLCVAEPKNGKSSYCKKFRRSVEAAENNAKAQDAKRTDGLTPCHDHFMQIQSNGDATRLRLG